MKALQSQGAQSAPAPAHSDIPQQTAPETLPQAALALRSYAHSSYRYLLIHKPSQVARECSLDNGVWL